MPERLVGYARSSPSVSRDIVVAIDQSGSMVGSVIHSAVTAACLWGLPGVRAHLVAFDPGEEPEARITAWRTAVSAALTAIGWPIELAVRRHQRLVDDALAEFECRTVSTLDAGDHTIVVGEVLTLAVGDAPEDALTYYRGAFGRLR